MTAEPPPPTITISDPNNPGVYGDVLGSGDEKPPWRPSRRQWQVLLAVGLVLLVALPPTLYLKHQGDERALDSRALDAIELVAVDNDDYEPDAPLTVSNEGPDPVTILSARIDRDGYKASPVGVTVKAGDEGRASLPFLAPCPGKVPFNGPTGVRLTVKTARGGEREVRVDIRDTNASYAFVDRIKKKCSLYHPSESVEVNNRFQLSVVGAEIVLHADLANLSVFRRDVTRIAISRGFRVDVSTPLPLVLPRATAGFQGDSVPLDARITITDCRLARAEIDDDRNDEDTYPPDVLQAQINGLDDGSDALLFFGENLLLAERELVAKSC